MAKAKQALNSITPEQQRVTDLKMSIAARIADIMKEQGITHEDFANHFKVPVDSVDLILSGAVLLDLKMIAKFENYLNRKIIDITPSV